MILEIKSSLLIINHKETIIKKESFILKNCRIQTIQIIPKKVSLTKIVFMIRKKNRRIAHIIENNKKIKIITLKELDHIEEEGALEEEEVVDSKITILNRKMKRLLDNFQPKIFNLIIRKTWEVGEIQITTRILTIINKQRNNHRKMTIKFLKKGKIVKVKKIDAEISID